jgi:hypothetical protein
MITTHSVRPRMSIKIPSRRYRNRIAQTRCGPDQWVREWPEGHPLPVVAMGLIPHIYRRAYFSHRATPRRLPIMGSSLVSHDGAMDIQTAQ